MVEEIKTKVNWFEEWFDTPYYHILYKHRDDKEANTFIDNLVNKIKISKQNKVLDVACGKGRFAKYISQKGIEVVGVDISPYNIASASLLSNDLLTFVQGDMRQMNYDQEFDFVLNMFTSFGYFDCEGDNLKAILSMAKALKPNGTLLLDFFNTEKVLRELPCDHSLLIDGIDFQIEKKIIGKYIIKNISIFDNGKIFQFQEKVQSLTKDDFIQYFSEAGLSNIKIFGNYHFDVWNKDSERTIFVATKNMD